MPLKLLLLALISFSSLSQTSLNVMSFNIRYATPSDGENQWEYRKHLVAQTISYFEADICGLQEATEPQVLYLAKQLKSYKWIGVGRDDGKSGGEFSPLFYNPSKLDLLKWETIWLSQTPDVPSKDWDAALPRIATIAHFSSKTNGENFVVINTHFDHLGSEARAESSKLLLKKIREFQFKVILLGDFNSTPTQEPILTFTKGGLKNTYDISEKGHFGPIDSFSGFLNNEKVDSQIDHIFVSEGIKVSKHATISQTWNGKLASDHHAILTTLRF